jgi:hypothetical protein
MRVFLLLNDHVNGGCGDESDGDDERARHGGERSGAGRLTHVARGEEA